MYVSFALVNTINFSGKRDNLSDKLISFFSFGGKLTLYTIQCII